MVFSPEGCCTRLLTSKLNKTFQKPCNMFVAQGLWRLVEDRFGEGKWHTINLQEVFTALEVEPDFKNTEGDLGAHLLLARNELVRYIRRIIGFCTQGTFGNYYKALAETIHPNDSVITFNWDLLLDQEFLEHPSLAS